MTAKPFLHILDNGRSIKVDLVSGDGKAPNVVIATPYFNSSLTLLEAEKFAKAVTDAVREGRAINARPKPFWK